MDVDVILWHSGWCNNVHSKGIFKQKRMFTSLWTFDSTLELQSVENDVMEHVLYLYIYIFFSIRVVAVV